MLSPSADPEVPMDYSTEYDASDKSSIDDSDEACSIPGSFAPDNNQDGTGGDQRYVENTNIWSKKKTTNKCLKECYWSSKLENNRNSNTPFTYYLNFVLLLLVFTSR